MAILPPMLFRLLQTITVVAFFSLCANQAAYAEALAILDSNGKFYCKASTKTVYRKRGDNLRAINKRSLSKLLKKLKEKALQKSANNKKIKQQRRALAHCSKGLIAPACEVVEQGAARQRIINGSICDKTQSVIVNIEMYDQFNQSLGGCSGTVISSAPIKILTAAHCLYFPETGMVHTVRIEYEDQTLESSAIHIHPNYINTISSPAADLGIVEFSHTSVMQPIKNYYSELSVSNPQLMVATGYGYTIPGVEPSGYDGQLRAAYALYAGWNAYIKAFGISYTNETSGICYGDSGGPLLVKTLNGEWRIMGVASQIYGDIDNDACGVGTMGLYTSTYSVSDNLNFIRQFVTDFGLN